MLTRVSAYVTSTGRKGHGSAVTPSPNVTAQPSAFPPNIHNGSPGHLPPGAQSGMPAGFPS
jgi:hypothetical protein